MVCSDDGSTGESLPYPALLLFRRQTDLPVIPSTYHAPPLLRNAHVHTVWAARVRQVPLPNYRRTRIDTPDGDFLDVDVSEAARPVRAEPADASRPTDPASSEGVVVISHGLGGNTSRRYMRGMVRAVNAAGWDAVAWNMRGCSGEPNRKLHSYHSGATEDLDAVVRWVVATRRPERVALVGFSLGGNVTLKYLGEREEGLDAAVVGAVAWSVPCELGDGADALARPNGTLYMRYLLVNLRDEVRRKQALFPGQIDDEGFERIRTFHEFDDRYTAPLNGYRDARHYWSECSSRRFLGGIRRPTLIVNSVDDPFLAGRCYPEAEAAKHPYVTLEMPAQGGHVGFAPMQGGRVANGRANGVPPYWSEVRTVEYLRQVLTGAPTAASWASPTSSTSTESSTG